MELQSLIDQLSVIDSIIICIYQATSITILSYYLLVFRKFAFQKETDKPNSQQPPVSVIIAAHNEDYNLQKNLPAILEQNYPDFEVVVVNHASNDTTLQILTELKMKYERLSIVNIEQDLNFFKGKKFPLSIGIKSAKNDVLLLTDADCMPSSPDWISKMARHYTSKNGVVLGYGPYKQRKGLLNLIIRYDTFNIALQYFSLATIGIPYMGVGRNLSYRKSIFYKNKGFTSHYNIASGDDDLFIREVATKSNTKIEVSRGSFMYSEPKYTFSSWFIQKLRHLSTSKKYSTVLQLLLGTFSISQFLFYITLVIMLAKQIIFIPVLIIFVVVTGSKFLVQKKAADKLGEHQILLFSLFGDFIHIILMTGLTTLSLIRKQGNWK
jgi:poly-beta-1,6-N-acetyl-D-glucosamine synthase